MSTAQAGRRTADPAYRPSSCRERSQTAPQRLRNTQDTGKSGHTISRPHRGAQGRSPAPLSSTAAPLGILALASHAQAHAHARARSNFDISCLAFPVKKEAVWLHVWICYLAWFSALARSLPPSSDACSGKPISCVLASSACAYSVVVLLRVSKLSSAFSELRSCMLVGSIPLSHPRLTAFSASGRPRSEARTCSLLLRQRRVASALCPRASFACASCLGSLVAPSRSLVFLASSLFAGVLASTLRGVCAGYEESTLRTLDSRSEE